MIREYKDKSFRGQCYRFGKKTDQAKSDEEKAEVFVQHVKNLFTPLPVD